MSDPIRIKDKTEICAKAVFNQNGSDIDVEFSVLAEKKVIDTLPKDTFEKMISRDASTMRFTKPTAIYMNQVSFQYENPDVLKDFDYGNIFVRAGLPYCLHIPNHYEIEVDIDGVKVLLIHRKIWTNKAKEDRLRSSEVDFYAKDKVTYFNTSTILTPKIPIDFDEGWEQNFTGRNIERIKDQNGTFRFSSFYIQFDKKVDKTALDGKPLDVILSEIKEISLVAVNKLIDSYRSVTRDAYVQRLGSLEINTVYFINHNQGFYILSSGFGIEGATMNRSKDEIVKIEEMLRSGTKPEIYDLLILDAQSSFDNKNYTLAVVQSFQAFEIFYENFLLKLLIQRGDSEADAINYLDQNWRTKDRLKKCLNDLKGVSLYDSNRVLWDKWCTLYDKTRNEIVHQGKEPSSTEVSSTLETNIELIEWIKSIG